MKIIDKIIEPYSRRYWAYTDFIGKFLPTNFGVLPYETSVNFIRMSGFIYSDPELAEKYTKYVEEIILEDLECSLADDEDDLL